MIQPEQHAAQNITANGYLMNDCKSWGREGEEIPRKKERKKRSWLAGEKKGSGFPLTQSSSYFCTFSFFSTKEKYSNLTNGLFSVKRERRKRETEAWRVVEEKKGGLNGELPDLLSKEHDRLCVPKKRDSF